MTSVPLERDGESAQDFDIHKAAGSENLVPRMQASPSPPGKICPTSHVLDPSCSTLSTFPEFDCGHGLSSSAWTGQCAPGLLANPGPQRVGAVERAAARKDINLSEIPLVSRQTHVLKTKTLARVCFVA